MLKYLSSEGISRVLSLDHFHSCLEVTEVLFFTDLIDGKVIGSFEQVQRRFHFFLDESLVNVITELLSAVSRSNQRHNQKKNKVS